ncbi:MAG TPA: TonB-dependent receptor, partial [Vicinamibacterales bacterium]|nr:TonB-dependent receptor [Vicinamibacterales bacterium]
ETNLTKEAVTDADGAFTVNNVLPGPYDVKVTLQGFRESVRRDVPVTIGQIARVTVALEVGSVNETVTVVSDTQLLQTDKADVHTELKSSEIVSMPLNRFRNYQALMNLVPGTTPMAFGNAETDTPARSLATNVNGQVNTNNTTRTDGATNMNIWLPNHNMYISPAETVDTVNISTSSFDAEQGNAGGAAVTVITKSGTNIFKGSGFEYYNSDKLNATPRFFGKGNTPDKLPLKSNTYGGTLGGPIARNKVFFFGSFEGFRRQQSLFTFFNVPDAKLRAGDFSGALNTNGTVQQIYDPLSGTAGGNGAGRTQFANNQIPSNRIDPIALKVLALFPSPNTAGTGAGGLTSNYKRQEDRTFNRDNMDGKVNWNRTSAHQIWGKFSYMNAVVDDLTNYLGPDPKATGDGGFTKVYQATAGQTWTLSPTMLMDMTFGFGRQDQHVYGPDFQAGNYGLSTLGIPGTNDQGSGDERYAGYPVFNTGFSAVGNRDGWNPIFRDERTYTLSTNMSKLKGRHDFRGGYLMNFFHLDHWQPETGNPRGQFDFNGATTALNATGAQTNNFYNQYASFLLGYVGTPAKSVQNEVMTAREWQHSFYMRDRWTPNGKLTFDLGLRYELYPIMHRADGRGVDRLDLTNPDFNHRLDVLIAGRGDNPQNNGMKMSWNNFAPRLGAIYRLNELTVLRTGYGLTYNATPWARAVRGDNDYPITIAASLPSVDTFGFSRTLAQGIPTIVPPNQSSGRIPLDRNAAEYTPETDNIDRGYTQTWNIAFERRIMYDISVDVAYVGAKGTDGYAALDINAPTVLGTGNQGRPYFNLIQPGDTQGRINAINSWGARLKTMYQSMQVSLNKPFTHGLLFKGAYTLSKSMNESDNDGRATLTWNTPSELFRNYAPAGFDRRHNFQMGFAYSLPWQSNGGHHDNVMAAIVNDWQINGLFAAFSGTPFTVTASGTSLNTPSNQQNADLVGTFTTTGKIGDEGAWFDTTAFAQPTGVRFGTSNRNQFYGPGGYNLDFSVFRSFPFAGTRRVEVRAEAGNLLNHGVYNNPQGSITSATFGQITSVRDNYPERQVRLGIRIQF